MRGRAMPKVVSDSTGREELHWKHLHQELLRSREGDPL